MSELRTHFCLAYGLDPHTGLVVEGDGEGERRVDYMSQLRQYMRMNKKFE